MKEAELREKARHAGIQHIDILNSAKQLVLAIQKARGEETCFLSDHRIQCRDHECEWRPDCIRLVAEWRR